MAETTGIEWADATINFWIGCTKVSAACDHCYAEAMAKRFGTARWGHGAPRVRSKSAVATAFKLERKAMRLGRRLKVFCNSMSDFFDAEVDDSWRDEAFAVMALTPHLTWLVLTKRPKVMREYITTGQAIERIYAHACDRDETLADRWVWPLPNVYLGVTAESQAMADLRIPDLRATPAARRFVSVEPMLGPMDLYNGDPDPRLGGHTVTHTFLGEWWEPGDHPKAPPRRGLDWVICGGESGPAARPMHPDWVRSLRDQCRAAEVPFFFKQWGARGHGSDFAPDAKAVLADGRVVDPDPDSLKAIDRDTPVPPLHPEMMRRVGKARAGRLLDGRAWSEVPG